MELTELMGSGARIMPLELPARWQHPAVAMGCASRHLYTVFIYMFNHGHCHNGHIIMLRPKQTSQMVVQHF